MKSIAHIIHQKNLPFTILDFKGNDIYYEDSNGDWWKAGYDDNGNELYYENSYGGWEEYEYDFNGNEIYYKNSAGLVLNNR